MKPRLLVFILVTLAFLSGCIDIPKSHITVNANGNSFEINQECLCKNSTLPAKEPARNTPVIGLNPGKITLVNWNCHKGRGQKWLQQFDALLPDTDLITLQEGALTDQLQKRLNYNFNNSWIIASAFKQSGIHTGVLTGSRIKSDFHCSFRTWEPIIFIPKTILITRYPIAGSHKTLLLINLHLINFSLTNRTYHRQLQEAYTILQQHRGPLLIAGDFNSWSKSRFAIINNIINKLNAKTLTFNKDLRTTFFGHTVDHIFYRGLTPLKSETEEVSVSDHNPMRVTFKVNQFGE